MKLSTVNIAIAGVILLLIISSLVASSTRFIPYDEKTIFAKQFPFEGFANLDYSGSQGAKVTDSMNAFNIDSKAPECSKVFGFDGLYCSPSTASKSYDIYSEAKGDTSCVGKSSGLSNSRGGLCLDNNQTAMLTTRGGNATGRDSEIGH